MDPEIIALIFTLVDPTAWPAWLVRVIVCLVVWAGLSGRIEPKLPAWRAAAARTPTKLDDQAVVGVSWLVRAGVFFGPLFEIIVMRRGRALGGDAPSDPPGGFKDDPYGDDTPVVEVPDLGPPDDRGAARIRTALVLTALALVGCGAAPWEVAQTTTSTIAYGVEITDTSVAEEYTEQARAALEEADALNDYRARMGRLDTVERALRAAHAFLDAAQAGIDAWRAGDAGDSWRAAMPCLAVAVSELASALVTAGVPIPPEIERGVELVGSFLGSRCVEATP